MMAAQPGCDNSDLATKPFRQLQIQQIKCTYIKLKAITTLALVLLILAALLPPAAPAATFHWSPTGYLANPPEPVVGTLHLHGLPGPGR
jgi:hypothetical protein